ncbi:CDGSH iron-sulfur domain-containing protein [Mycobacterium sp. BMJ-28]
MTTPQRTIVQVIPGGPVVVEGPVSIQLPDGQVVDSDRFKVAICACRRSRTYPLCDTSHRKKIRKSAQRQQE